MDPRRPARLALLVLALATPASGARAEGEAVTGMPWTGSVGIPRTVAEIMAVRELPSGTVAAVRGASERRPTWPDRTNLPVAPDAMDAVRWPPAEAGLEGAGGLADPITTGPQTPALTFPGATLAGGHPTFSFPADAMGAVGPTQYVVLVNGRLTTYDKATGLADGVLDTDPDTFFAGINNGSGTTDPRVRYDRLSGRWFLVVMNTAAPSWVLLAVSDAASHGVISPSTVFWFYVFSIDTPPPAISLTCTSADPSLGIDANALYIGTTNFCGAPPAYHSCDGFVVRKSSVLSGGPMVVTALRGLVASPIADGPVAPQGVDNLDPAAAEGYFIGVSNTLFGRLVLRRVATPGGTPSVSGNITIAVPSTAFPLTVPHLGNTGGTAGNLSATDDRLFAAHLRDGRLWTAHNISVNHLGSAAAVTRTRNAARWYELAGIASPDVPAIVQSGTVFAPSASNTTDQAHFIYPTVMVSGQGHALLGMTTAGSAIRIDAATTGRLVGDALGTMATPTAYTTSATAYNPPGDPGGPDGRRWGDYSYTALDPTDDMTMWSIQMYCDVTDSYACQVVKMLAPPPATPASADEVNANMASVPCMVVGASTGGSGFYDPGPDLPGVPGFSHITATVTNDGVTGTPPTVNGVTYIDPTHVLLDLNTVGATPSLPGEMYTVTITNPDGQAATGSMILKMGAEAAVGHGPGPGFALDPVSPNPSPGPAGVGFAVGRETKVRITVVDLAGREIATLADGVLPAGRHRAHWSGGAGAGRAAAGLYVIRYEADGGVLVRRFVLLR